MISIASIFSVSGTCDTSTSSEIVDNLDDDNEVVVLRMLELIDQLVYRDEVDSRPFKSIEAKMKYVELVMHDNKLIASLAIKILLNFSLIEDNLDYLPALLRRKMFRYDSHVNKVASAAIDKIMYHSGYSTFIIWCWCTFQKVKIIIKLFYPKNDDDVIQNTHRYC